MPVTKPGYQVCSSSFIVKFFSGNKFELEECINWKDMMMHLLNAFEMWPWDMARIERETMDFDIWVERVEITDTFSRIKRVNVHLDETLRYPPARLMLTFEVKRKQEMKKLLTLAAETVSDFVSKKEDFEHLEVPEPVLADLNEAYDDIIWRGNMK